MSNEHEVKPATAVVAQPGKVWATVRLTGRGVTITAGGQKSEVTLDEMLDRFAAQHPEVALSRPDPIQ